MPPNWIWRGCILAGISPSKTEGAVEEVDSSACSAGPGASGSLDSWGGGWEMVADGVWWTFLWGGGAGTWRNVTLLPSEAHKNPQPLSLPLPLPSSPGHRPPNTVPPFLISGLPPIGCPPFSVDPAPRRWKSTGVEMWKEVESHMKTPKEGKEINSPVAEAPMPLPWVKQEAPHLHPATQSLHVLLFLGSVYHYLLTGGLICPRKKGERHMSGMCKEKKIICI